jgi:phospholipid transport system substrate-binding protein
MKTTQRVLPNIIAVVLLTISGAAQALAPLSPNALLEDTTDKMFDALNKDRNSIKANPTHTQKIVEDILMPNIDIITSSKWVLGKYWDDASKEQKLRFIREFRTMLLRFYSSALSEYLNSHEEKLEKSIMRFTPTNEADQKEVIVRSEVTPKNSKAVPVLYHMHLTDKGWKVFDVSVEGVSVITTYKTSFANDIQQNGIDGLIASLVERNQKLLASGTKALSDSQKPPGLTSK